MKKLFLTCAFMCTFGTLSVFAQQTDKPKVIERYYGEKASDGGRNPCRGYLKKVCYEKIQELQVATDWDYDDDALLYEGEKTLVTTTIRRPDGEVIDEYKEVYDGDVNAVKQQLMNNAFMNCGEVEVR